MGYWRFQRLGINFTFGGEWVKKMAKRTLIVEIEIEEDESGVGTYPTSDEEYSYPPSKRISKVTLDGKEIYTVDLGRSDDRHWILEGDEDNQIDLGEMHY